MHEFRKVCLLGLIIGIILEVAGFVSLDNYFANTFVYNYLLGGIGVVICWYNVSSQVCACVYSH
jgi:hypothetical protein